MATICSGAGGVGKPGYDRFLFMAPTAIGALLNNAPTPWAVFAAALIGSVTYDLTQLCPNDPPAYPTITSDDVQALLLPQLDIVANYQAVQKFHQLLKAIAWYQFCECASVATPTLPTPPAAPTDMPDITPTIPNTGFYPMRTGEVRALTLGCNPTPPTNWHLPGFNDSAWATPALGTLSGNWGTPIGYQYGATQTADATLSGYPVQYFTPATPPAHNCEEFLLRWRFRLGNVVPSQTKALRTWIAGGGSGVSSGQFFVNGQGGNALLNAISWQSANSLLVPNAENLIAVWVNSGNTASASTWGTDMGFALALDYNQSTPQLPVTDCCEQTATMLQRVLDMVTLIQRQAVPFGYIESTPHTGLTGAGSLSVSGLLGVKVECTARPTSLGTEGTSPERLFDLGYITFGTPDGYPHSARLEHDPQLILPSRASAYTEVAYDLHPGVTVTITELIREP